MEVKINKDIREIKEKVAGGMSLKQIAAASIGVFFCIFVIFRLRSISNDLAAFSCVLAILPFAVIGDFLPKVNGIPFRKFIVVWLRYSFLEPRELRFSGRNYRKEIFVSSIAAMERMKKIENQKAEKSKRKNRHSKNSTADHTSTASVEGRHFFKRKDI